MKQTLFALIAACFAMMSTSGLVALATAAPIERHRPRTVTPAPSHDVELELVAHLDTVLQGQLDTIKAQLAR